MSDAAGATEHARPACVALSGGVGGAKLALGLSAAMDPARLMIIANTGDDFEHLGLHVCPDVDTLMYTLAGLANVETGWGRAGETWTFLAALEALGGDTWFKLGDGDLATHVERTRRLRAGEGLGRITADLCARFGIQTRIVPMSDDPVRTMIDTKDGRNLAFQHYFVRLGCAPEIAAIRFAGAPQANPDAALLAALSTADAVVICPSNPLISIDPILAVPALRAALEATPAPIVAVSPIIGGRALKGPTAKMMAELGMAVSAAAVARHYGDLLDGFVLDSADAVLAVEVRRLGIEVLVADTVMTNLDERRALARDVLGFATRLRLGATASQQARPKT